MIPRCRAGVAFGPGLLRRELGLALGGFGVRVRSVGSAARRTSSMNASNAYASYGSWRPSARAALNSSSTIGRCTARNAAPASRGPRPISVPGALGVGEVLERPRLADPFVGRVAILRPGLLARRPAPSASGASSAPSKQARASASGLISAAAAIASAFAGDNFPFRNAFSVLGSFLTFFEVSNCFFAALTDVPEIKAS